VAILAGAAFCGLLALSRKGRQVWASWGILAAFYLVATWLFNAEGTEEPIAIILCTVSVVAAGVLLGSRVSLLVVAVLTVTLVAVTAVGSSGGDDLDVVGQLGVGGGLAALALVLSARTVEPRESVGQLLSAAQEVGLANAVLADLTVRELQVVRLIAAGRSNDEIASELFVSPRTVHTHVSNALRKTGCTNRPELAVLAISGTVRRQLSAAAKPVG
jgi:DNA-binding CsgD family transcriptional regulator